MADRANRRTSVVPGVAAWIVGIALGLSLWMSAIAADVWLVVEAPPYSPLLVLVALCVWGAVLLRDRLPVRVWKAGVILSCLGVLASGAVLERELDRASCEQLEANRARAALLQGPSTLPPVCDDGVEPG